MSTCCLGDKKEKGNCRIELQRTQLLGLGLSRHTHCTGGRAGPVGRPSLEGKALPEVCFGKVLAEGGSLEERSESNESRLSRRRLEHRQRAG